MQPPSRDRSTEFEHLLQYMPPELESLAVQSKAFSFGRKVKNVRQLLWLVLLYCGLDKVLRELSALFLLRHGMQLVEQSLRERLEHCVEWVKLLVPRMLPKVPVEELGQRRLVLVDASVVDKESRVHLCMD